MGWKLASFIILVATAMASPELYPNQVILSPGRIQIVETVANATEIQPAIQKVSLSPHQVTNIVVNGSIITGGHFRVEFCKFDRKLPGYVQHAPALSSQSAIVVVTEAPQDVKAKWQDFGVDRNYPVRISWNESVSGHHGQEYLIDFDRCATETVRDCKATVPLGRDYKGIEILYGYGSVWGCSWSSTTNLAHDASADEVKAAVEAVLGAEKVLEVKRKAAQGMGWEWEVVFSKGSVGHYAEVRTAGMMVGSGVRGVVEKKSPGLASGGSFSDVEWDGFFKLGLGGEMSSNISPHASTTEVADALRGLAAIGPDVQVNQEINDPLSWIVTFVNEVGLVQDLEADFSQLAPFGTRVEVKTLQAGQATVGGFFGLKYDSKSTGSVIPHDASVGEMRNALENLGLTDVSVTRAGPDASNGYRWAVTFLGDCLGQNVVAGMKTTPACEVELSEGGTELLTGNGATLVTFKPMYATVSGLDLFPQGVSDSEGFKWKQDSSIPASLESGSFLDDTEFTTQVSLPTDPTAAGMYTFSLSSDSDSELGKVVVYLNARPPLANPGPSVDVSWDEAYATLNASLSEAYYGAAIDTYEWKLVQRPAGSSLGMGNVVQPFNKVTVASQLNAPGSFLYSLKVTDVNGLSASAILTVNVNFPPSIAEMPDVNAVPDSRVEIECLASGSEPLTYEWYNGPTLLSDFNERTLVLENVTNSEEGYYRCKAINTVGVQLSNAAYLQIFDKPVVTLHPINANAVPGENAVVDFECAGEGNPQPTYFWEFAFGKPDTTGIIEEVWEPVPAGWTEPSPTVGGLRLSSVDESMQGDFRCRLENVAGTTYSSAAFLSVLDPPTSTHVVVQPAKALRETQGMDPGETFNLYCNSVPSHTEASTQHFWYRNSFGPPSIDLGQASVNFSQTAWRTGFHVEMLNASGTDNGFYSCVAVNPAGVQVSDVVQIFVNYAPVILEHPPDLVVDPGEDVSICVSAVGSGVLNYLWQKDNNYLYNGPNATKRCLNLTDVSAAKDAGVYTVVVYNTFASVTSESAVLTVTLPPEELTNPLGSEVDPGAEAVLYCEVGGTPPMSFFWKFLPADLDPFQDADQATQVLQHVEVSGPSWAQLTIPVVGEADQGYYACVAQNNAGSFTSSFGFLQVSDLPYIVKNPVDTFVDPGQTAVLKCDASGAKPLTFQWRKDGVAIPGTNSSTLSIKNAQATDEAGYDCRVTNRLNPTPGALSSVGRLYLAKKPEVLSHPNAVRVDPGVVVELESKFRGAPPMTIQWFFTPNGGSDKKKVSEILTDEGTFVSTLVVSENASEAEDGQYYAQATNRLGSVQTSNAVVRVNNVPVILSTPVTRKVNPGDDVRLECEFDADPAVDSTISWILESTKGGQIALSENSAVLNLEDLQQEDEGDYLCMVSNSAGFVQSRIATIEVRDPPFFEFFTPVNWDETLRLDEGERVDISVVASGVAPLEYTWFLDEKQIQKGSSSKYTIVYADTDDEGAYTVKVKNALGSTMSEALVMELNTPALASLSVFPSDTRLPPGQQTVLTCRGQGSAPITFEWFHKKTELDTWENVNNSLFENGRYYLEEKNSSSVLQIQGLQISDEGFYECSASNSARPAGALSGVVEILTIRPPLISSWLPLNVNAFPGTTAVFKCGLEMGTPPISFQWFRDEIEIFPDSRVEWEKCTSYGTCRDIKNKQACSNANGCYPGSPFSSKGCKNSPSCQGVTEPKLGTIQDKSELHLVDASDQDMGAFKCRACNSIGACDTSRPALLQVYKSPVITNQAPVGGTKTVDPGTRLELSCTAKGVEPLSILWRKNGIEVTLVENQVFYMGTDGCNRANQPCTLVLEGVVESLEGDYSCLATNALGETTSENVTLHVNDPPRLEADETWPESLTSACPGLSFQHQVVVTGSVPLTVEFFKSDSPKSVSEILKSGVRVSQRIAYSAEDLVNVTQLRITEPSPDRDSGYYAYRMSNSAGTLISPRVAFLEANPGPQAAADASGESPRHAVNLPTTQTQLNGLGSSDPGGQLVRFQWTFLGVQNNRSALSDQVVFTNPTEQVTNVHGLSTPGEFVFELTVWNSKGCANSDQVMVVVNTPGVALADDLAVALPVSNLKLDASRSYDPDDRDSALEFKWTFLQYEGEDPGFDHSEVSLTSPSTAVTGVTGVTRLGTYFFRLRIQDNDGALTFLTLTLFVFGLDLNPMSNRSFVAGDCYEHSIKWELEGMSPDLIKDTRALVLVRSIQDPDLLLTLASRPLSEFPSRSFPDNSVVEFSHNWAVSAAHAALFGALSNRADVKVEVLFRVPLLTQRSDMDSEIEANKGWLRRASAPIHLGSEYGYKEGIWGKCTKSLESESECVGVQHRTMTCARFSSCSSKTHNLVPDAKCSEMGMTKPPTSQTCVIEKCLGLGQGQGQKTHEWAAANWDFQACSASCDLVLSKEGGVKPITQTRQVDCLSLETGEKVKDTGLCGQDKPISEKECDACSSSNTANELKVRGVDQSAWCAKYQCWNSESEFPPLPQQCVGVSGQPRFPITKFCPDQDLKSRFPSCSCSLPNKSRWKVSAWECVDRALNFATRQVTCPEGDCPAGSKPETEGQCQVAVPSAAYYKVGDWEDQDCLDGVADLAQCLKKTQSRAVTCETVNEERFGECADLVKPALQRSCPLKVCLSQTYKRRLTSRTTCSLSENERCGDHGECQVSGSSSNTECKCSDGYSGPFCSTPPSCDGILDAQSKCCSSGLLSIQGDCCPSGSSLDFQGKCCSKPLDKCGVCGGETSLVDAQGKCCSKLAKLDAGGRCCKSGLLDVCGVCDGNGLSCAEQVDLWFNLSDPVPGYAALTSETRLVDIGVELKRMIQDSYEIPNQDIQVFRVADSTTKTCNSTKPKLSASLAVLPSPSLKRSELSQVILSNFGSKNLSVACVETAPRGVCGNNICEAQENCKTAGAGSACCPQDCPLGQVETCDTSCDANRNGRCVKGQCECYPPYTGDSCLECSFAAGWDNKTGTCMVSAPQTRVLNNAQTCPESSQAPPEPETKTETKTLIWPIFVVLGVVLLAGLGFWWWQRRQNTNVAPPSTAEKPKDEPVYVVDPSAAQAQPKAQPPLPKRPIGLATGIPSSVAATDLHRGWMWKRSRKGLGGKYVWKQWFVLLSNSNTLAYFDSENMADEDPQKRVGECGSIDLTSANQIQVLGHDKHGYHFMLVSQKVKPSLGSSRKESKTTTRHRFLVNTKHEMDAWIEALGTCNKKLQLVDTSAKIKRNRRGSIDSKSNAGSGWSSASDYSSGSEATLDREPVSALAAVATAANGIVLGSFSGAVGSRVPIEGWVELLSSSNSYSKSTKLYVGLFADLNLLRFFTSMLVAGDGATKFVGQKSSVDLTKVQAVRSTNHDLEMDLHMLSADTPDLTLRFGSRTEKTKWALVLSQELQHKLGRDIVSKDLLLGKDVQDALHSDENQTHKHLTPTKRKSLGRSKSQTLGSVRSKSSRTLSFTSASSNDNDDLNINLKQATDPPSLPSRGAKLVMDDFDRNKIQPAKADYSTMMEDAVRSGNSRKAGSGKPPPGENDSKLANF